LSSLIEVNVSSSAEFERMTVFTLMLTFEGDPNNQNDYRLFPFTRNFKLSVKLGSRVRLYDFQVHIILNSTIRTTQ